MSGSICLNSTLSLGAQKADGQILCALASVSDLVLVVCGLVLVTLSSQSLSSYRHMLLDVPSLGSDAAAIKDLNSVGACMPMTWHCTRNVFYPCIALSRSTSLVDTSEENSVNLILMRCLILLRKSVTTSRATACSLRSTATTSRVKRSNVSAAVPVSASFTSNL